jgi:hypothetical protein
VFEQLTCALSVKPIVQVGCSKPPQLTDVRSVYLAASRKLLQGFVMNLE